MRSLRNLPCKWCPPLHYIESDQGSHRRPKLESKMYTGENKIRMIVFDKNLTILLLRCIAYMSTQYIHGIYTDILDICMNAHSSQSKGFQLTQPSCAAPASYLKTALQPYIQSKSTPQSPVQQQFHVKYVFIISMCIDLFIGLLILLCLCPRVLFTPIYVQQLRVNSSMALKIAKNSSKSFYVLKYHVHQQL